MLKNITNFNIKLWGEGIQTEDIWKEVYDNDNSDNLWFRWFKIGDFYVQDNWKGRIKNITVN